MRLHNSLQLQYNCCSYVIVRRKLVYNWHLCKLNMLQNKVLTSHLQLRCNHMIRCSDKKPLTNGPVVCDPSRQASAHLSMDSRVPQETVEVVSLSVGIRPDKCARLFQASKHFHVTNVVNLIKFCYTQTCRRTCEIHQSNLK